MARVTDMIERAVKKDYAGFKELVYAELSDRINEIRKIGVDKYQKELANGKTDN